MFLEINSIKLKLNPALPQPHLQEDPPLQPPASCQRTRLRPHLRPHSPRRWLVCRCCTEEYNYNCITAGRTTNGSVSQSVLEVLKGPRMKFTPLRIFSAGIR